MTLHQKIFAIIAALSIFIAIIYLVKHGNLREEYAWLWLLTGFGIFLLAIWYKGLLMLTYLIGAVAPTTTLFIFAIFFLVLIALHFAVKISKLTNQVKNLAQKLSLLETQINKMGKINDK
ncbi:MAG: DUF2304 domain-containing protein [Desulfobacterales bacterium]|nr:DUF2304 domain-containing protein [Desulfobacterales bacterium]